MDYIAGWLYEPGMDFAYIILWNDIPPRFVQIVGITPNSYWDAGESYDSASKKYRDWLIESNRSIKLKPEDTK